MQGKVVLTTRNAVLVGDGVEFAFVSLGHWLQQVRWAPYTLVVVYGVTVTMASIYRLYSLHI